MLFNSIEFFLFLGITLAVLALLPGRRLWRLGVFGAGQVFYGWWDWRFLALFWFAMVANWWFGERIAAALRSGGKPGRWLACGVAIDIGILAVFKYAGFFAENLRAALAGVGLDPGWPMLHIALPLGISFYTFQAVSYLVDIRRERIAPARSLFEFSLYLSFFPVVIAGPIERAAELIPQLRAPAAVDRRTVREACYLILWGLFKKVVVADTLAIHANRVYGLEQPDAGSVLVGMLAFTFQIYADFSAYSDIAIGCGLLLGVRLQKNFAEPYLALGPGEFWQRWHISLSQWLRDYLFFPLGGSSRGEGRMRVNLILTFLIGGLWHGAAWTFVLWGLYQGAFLVIGRVLDVLRRRGYQARTGRAAPRVFDDPAGVRFARWLLTFLATMAGMAIFRCDGVDEVGRLAAGLAGGEFSGRFWRDVLVVGAFASPLAAHDLMSRRTGDPCWPVKRGRLLAVLALLGLIYGIVILGMPSGGQFIYFQF